MTGTGPDLGDGSVPPRGATQPSGPTAPDPGTAGAWPVAQLDRVARLRVLAESLPGTVVQERLIDAPFGDVWGFVADLETSVPAFDRDVARLRVVRSSGERMRVHSWVPHLPGPVPFDVDLRPGWCWMVSSPRLYVVGMAAEAAGDRTRFAHLEGLVVPGPGAARTLAAPLLRLSRRRHQRHVGRDLDGIERGVAARRGREGPE
jgi:hypothetical protein